MQFPNDGEILETKFCHWHQRSPGFNLERQHVEEKKTDFQNLQSVCKIL